MKYFLNRNDFEFRVVSLFKNLLVGEFEIQGFCRGLQCFI